MYNVYEYTCTYEAGCGVVGRQHPKHPERPRWPWRSFRCAETLETVPAQGMEWVATCVSHWCVHTRPRASFAPEMRPEMSTWRGRDREGMAAALGIKVQT